MPKSVISNWALPRQAFQDTLWSLPRKTFNYPQVSISVSTVLYKLQRLQPLGGLPNALRTTSFTSFLEPPQILRWCRWLNLLKLGAELLWIGYDLLHDFLGTSGLERKGLRLNDLSWRSWYIKGQCIRFSNLHICFELQAIKVPPPWNLKLFRYAVRHQVVPCQQTNMNWTLLSNYEEDYNGLHKTWGRHRTVRT